ncbi:MAG: pilus assembly protein PilZ [Sulfitobacter sp.]
MTSDTTGTVTPQKVKDLATQAVTLPRVALIGIFGSEAASGALIRSPNGKIERVKVGDRAAGGIVAAIGKSKVIIATRGATKVLELPAS